MAFVHLTQLVVVFLRFSKIIKNVVIFCQFYYQIFFLLIFLIVLLISTKNALPSLRINIDHIELATEMTMILCIAIETLHCGPRQIAPIALENLLAKAQILQSQTDV